MAETALPYELYTVAQTRKLDQRACELLGCAPFELMQRAARATLSLIQQRWPTVDRLLIVCGKGNNGGDGLVLAALAARAFMQVDVYLTAADTELSDTAKQAYAMALGEDAAVNFVKAGELDAVLVQANLVVDALLGTGFYGELDAGLLQLTEVIHRSAKPVLALDVPSGLNADSGQAAKGAVRAQATLCFITVKPGLLMHQGLDCCGEVLFSDLDVPADTYQTEVPALWLNPARSSDLPQRRNFVHKYDCGHVLVVGGSQGMGGAGLLAAEAAARAGAGLVSLATHPEHVQAMLARCPDVMVSGINSGQELEPLLEKPDVIIIGPGMSANAWSEQMLQACLKTQCPLVIDAGALGLLRRMMNEALHERSWVLLPHPGEAAGMLDTSSAEIQADRLAAVAALQQRYGGVCVLKGAGTLIATEEQIWLTAEAEAALATAGSGDVLAGITGAFMAQGLSAQRAAAWAVKVHVRAARLCAAERAVESVLASDVVAAIGRVLR